MEKLIQLIKVSELTSKPFCLWWRTNQFHPSTSKTVESELVHIILVCFDTVLLLVQCLFICFAKALKWRNAIYSDKKCQKLCFIVEESSSWGLVVITCEKIRTRFSCSHQFLKTLSWIWFLFFFFFFQWVTQVDAPNSLLSAITCPVAYLCLCYSRLLFAVVPHKYKEWIFWDLTYWLCLSAGLWWIWCVGTTERPFVRPILGKNQKI